MLIEADGLAERGTFIINLEGKIVGYKQEEYQGNIERWTSLPIVRKNLMMAIKNCLLQTDMFL